MESTLDAFGILSPPEVRFLEAAVECLIPTDELGPGAKEAGVVVYIDRQLSSSWGAHGRQYRSGPWFEGTPQQGYQSRLTPLEIYRVGIREIDDDCKATHGRVFSQMNGALQQTVLKALEKGEVDLPSVPAKLFFDLLWRNTEEGYFADPLYGGNRNMVGWRLLGFPGIPSAAYREHLTVNEPYRAEPVSMLDIQTKKVPVTSEGFAKHIMIKPVKDQA